jgi:large subunit ribosomal protein L25
MKSLEINASLRKGTGKKQTEELRKNGMVPCVMYGGKEVVHFAAPDNDFRHLIYTNHVYLVKLSIDGKSYQAVLKDAQFHPVTDKLSHIDFVEVTDNKMVIVSLPVIITGNAAGVKAGGKMRQKRRYLKVKGLIKDFPETLVIDITNLNIGDAINVGDLKYDNLELLDPKRSMVVGVTTSRIAKGMEAGEEVPVAGAVEGAAEEAAKAGSESKEKSDSASEK